MPVRLNITMDEGLYRRLKDTCPPKGISRFISEAARARLHPESLDRRRLRGRIARLTADELRDVETAVWVTLGFDPG